MTWLRPPLPPLVFTATILAPILAHAAPPAEQPPPPASERSPAIEAPTPTPAATPAMAPTAPPPTAQPAPCSPCPRIPPKNKRGAGLLVGGVSLTGFTYMMTSLGGAIAIDRANTRLSDMAASDEARAAAQQRRRWGRRLTVPLIGPFIALREAPRARDAWATALSGSVQVLGVVLTAVGAARYARYKRARRWALSAGPMAGGAQLSLRVRF